MMISCIISEFQESSFCFFILLNSFKTFVLWR